METLRAFYRRIVPLRVRQVLWNARHPRPVVPAQPALSRQRLVLNLRRSIEAQREANIKLRRSVEVLRDGPAGFKARKADFFFCTADMVLANWQRVERALAGAVPPDLIVAHELLASGFAGQRAVSTFGAKRAILDNVEFPGLSGRSGLLLSARAQNDLLGYKLMDAFNGELANHYDAVTASSESQAEELRNMGVRAPIILLRHGRLSSDLVRRRSRKIRTRCGCKASDVLILYANHVYPRGGAEEALRALAHLPPRFRMVFLGEIRGVEDEIKHLVHELGLSTRALFLDPVDPGELIAYASGADLALLPLHPDIPNHATCLPNRVFESIAARNPIVAPTMTEIGRFVKAEGIGATFNSFAPETIASVIETAASRSFKSALERAARRYSWEREQEALIRLIEPGMQRALLLACKTIDRNHRIYKLSKTLLDQGLDLTVVAWNEPKPELRHRGATYVVA